MEVHRDPETCTTVYNPINKSTKSLAHVLANDVDLVGTALLTAFATIFLIGINWCARLSSCTRSGH